MNNKLQALESLKRAKISSPPYVPRMEPVPTGADQDRATINRAWRYGVSKAYLEIVNHTLKRRCMSCDRQWPTLYAHKIYELFYCEQCLMADYPGAGGIITPKTKCVRVCTLMGGCACKPNNLSVEPLPVRKPALIEFW